jgi:hypothetical protein
MAHEITLTELADDRYEVHRDRVPVLGGTCDLDYAKDYVRRTRTPDEKVILVEQDGYRVDITRDFAREPRRRR